PSGLPMTSDTSNGSHSFLSSSGRHVTQMPALVRRNSLSRPPRNLRLPLKTALAHFAPVRRTGLEGPRRVELTRPQLTPGTAAVGASLSHSAYGPYAYSRPFPHWR